MNSEPPFGDPALLSRQELEKQARALFTVLRISRAVHEARTLDELFERAVDAIVQYTDFPSVALYRLDRTQAVLHLMAARGFPQASRDAGQRLPVEGSATGEAIRQGRIYTTGDLRADPRLVPAVRTALEHDGFVAAASIPLLGFDGAVGALNLIYRHPAALAESEHPTLMAIGQSIGLALSQHLAADERKLLQEHAFRAQQLESLGVLAGGIAHDFNNILTGILGNVSLASSSLHTEQAHTVPGLLSEIELACRRAAELSRQLLTFARGGAPVRRAREDLPRLVEEAARFAARGSSIQIQFETQANIGDVSVDAGQIMQVVQNLVLNAIQASAPGAAVRVATYRRDERVVLEVEDHGVGISAEDQARVFEPYFTRREGGTGLGLAMTHSIVERHGGSIALWSQPGAGTRISVELPAPALTPQPAEATPSVPAGPALTGRRVLVLDDDPRLIPLLQRMLADLGARAVSARTGEQACALFEEALHGPEPFDLLLLDLTVVGGMGGRQTLEQLRVQHGGPPAVAMSGYSNDPVLAEPARHGFAHGLSKPFSLSELEAALATALRAQPASAS